MTKTKVEKRISWLKQLNKNIASQRKRAYQTERHFVDSEGHELKLEPYIRIDNNYASSSLTVLDLSRYIPDKNVRLDLGGVKSDDYFNASRLEARLILGKESLISSNTNRRTSYPRLYPYEVENWELQAMLNVTLSDHPWGSTHYSLGRKEQIGEKLIIPVAHYCGCRIKDKNGQDQKPVIDLGNWSREKLIEKVRAELKKK